MFSHRYNHAHEDFLFSVVDVKACDLKVGDWDHQFTDIRVRSISQKRIKAKVNCIGDKWGIWNHKIVTEYWQDSIIVLTRFQVEWFYSFWKVLKVDCF